MNILLVYPDYPDGFWTFNHVLRKYTTYSCVSPPIGLLTVAAMLPKEWNLRLIDTNAKGKIRDKDIRWADYVFISAMHLQWDAVRCLVDRCKSFGVKTVAGGPLFTRDYQSFDDIDHLLLYEGEVCVPQFLEDIKNNTTKHIYDWVEFPDMRNSPVPRWDMINVNHYARLNLQYTRGCPFNCEFCGIGNLFGRKTRAKDASQIIAEIETIYETGWRGPLFFVDDTFTGNKKKLKEELLPILIDWSRKKGYPFTFLTQTSINLADDEELMNLMTDAGFNTVFIGIETIDPDCLAEVNKNENLQRNLVESVRRIQQSGMQVQAGFILGFDNDKPTIFDQMIHFIQDSGIITAMIGLLIALPHTKLYERLKAEGRIIVDFTAKGTNIIPKMDMDILIEGYRKVVFTIYSPKIFYERIKIFIENYRPKNHCVIKTEIKDFFPFFRSCISLGLIHKGRWEYWKLLKWAYLREGNDFALTVSLAIWGYHMRVYLPKKGIPDAIG